MRQASPLRPAHHRRVRRQGAGSRPACQAGRPAAQPRGPCGGSASAGRRDRCPCRTHSAFAMWAAVQLSVQKGGPGPSRSAVTPCSWRDPARDGTGGPPASRPLHDSSARSLSRVARPWSHPPCEKVEKPRLPGFRSRPTCPLPGRHLCTAWLSPGPTSRPSPTRGTGGKRPFSPERKLCSGLRFPKPSPAPDRAALARRQPHPPRPQSRWGQGEAAACEGRDSQFGACACGGDGNDPPTHRAGHRFVPACKRSSVTVLSSPSPPFNYLWRWASIFRLTDEETGSQGTPTSPGTPNSQELGQDSGLASSEPGSPGEAEPQPHALPSLRVE